MISIVKMIKQLIILALMLVIKCEDYISLFEVMLHEVGHSLRLAYTNVENTVMYPIFFLF